jgi:hypothetical protein
MSQIKLFAAFDTNLTLTLNCIDEYSWDGKQLPQFSRLGVAMNQYRTEFPGDLAVANDARMDRQKHDIVQHGISMQQSSNTMSAVEYLKSRDVAPHVIERVLLDPRRRRSLD